MGAFALASSLLSASVLAAPGDWQDRSDFWVTASQMDYHEPGLMKEEGDFQGFGISSVHPFSENWQAKLSTEAKFGNMDYTGSTWGGDALKTKTDDTIIQSALTVGYKIPLLTAVIVPYAGLGGRYWHQEIEDKTLANGVQAQGYTRSHTYLYVPVGASYHTNLGNVARLSLSGEYREVVYGQAAAGIEGVSDMDFNGGYGVALSARFDSLDYPVWGELYSSRWSLEESDTTELGNSGAYVVEPENHTEEVGLRVGFSW